MTSFFDAVGDADYVQIILVIVAVLAVVDMVLLRAAMARFQRARLILD